MLTKNAKIFMSIGIGSIVAASIAAPISIYLIKKQNHSDEHSKIKKHNEDKIEESVFPNLESKQYYDFIRYIENGTFWDKNIVGAVISDVIKTLKTTDGEIKFDYKFSEENKKVEIYFEWKNIDTNPIYKTYTFSIHK